MKQKNKTKIYKYNGCVAQLVMQWSFKSQSDRFKSFRTHQNKGVGCAKMAKKIRIKIEQSKKPGIRIPIPRPGCSFKDKSKYSRKVKHKNGVRY